MKEIGQKLKLKREENGVSVEEAANDLKLRPSQIISIEEGKKEDFKDIFYLKYFIRDYAKYLGLDGEKLVDEFNEYMFDCTSKISVDDIAKASLEYDKKMKNKKFSPYTVKKKDKLLIHPIWIVILSLVVLIVIGYVVFSNYPKDEFSEATVTYKIGG